jgi:calcineurin-like phosphoesterase family protein
MHINLIGIALGAVIIGCTTLASAPDDAGVKTTLECPELPEEPTGPIHVALLGDRTGNADDLEYEKILNQIARIKPDMVIAVGDLIEGYQHDDQLEKAAVEWDQVLESYSRALGDLPLFSTAGNHDVWSTASLELFEKRLKHPVNYAFDLGDTRVILFDTSRVENEAAIEEKDLDWLWDELYGARDRAARIVITHRPLWAIDPGGQYGSPLHDVFIAGRANWVISGHWHHAMADDRDGVRYRLIGTSGGLPNRPGHPESGNFHHFGLLTIDGDEVALSLIPSGSIMSSRTFGYELNQLEWAIENRGIVVSGFEMDGLNPARTGRFEATITNVTQHQLKTVLVFENSKDRWRIRPASRSLELAPGKSTNLRLDYSRNKQTSPFPGPRATLDYPWPGRTGKTYSLDTRLRPILTRRAGRSKVAPLVDGRLDDVSWRDANDLGLLNDIQGPTLAGESRSQALIVGQVLYLGFQISEPDMARQKRRLHERNSYVEDEDHIIVLLDPSSTDPGHVRIAIGAGGGISYQHLGADPATEDDSSWLNTKTAAVTHDEAGWSVELAIPLESLGIPTDTKRIGFNFARGRLRPDAASRGWWQPLLEHEEESLGVLILR